MLNEIIIFNKVYLNKSKYIKYSTTNMCCKLKCQVILVAILF